MRARWYDSSLKRFISRDPLGMSSGANLYAYVDNNPMIAIDPTGLAKVVIWEKIILTHDSFGKITAKIQLKAIWDTCDDTVTIVGKAWNKVGADLWITGNLDILSWELTEFKKHQNLDFRFKVDPMGSGELKGRVWPLPKGTDAVNRSGNLDIEHKTETTYKPLPDGIERTDRVFDPVHEHIPSRGYIDPESPHFPDRPPSRR